MSGLLLAIASLVLARYIHHRDQLEPTLRYDAPETKHPVCLKSSKT